MLNYINRAMEPTILQISSTFPVLLLTGPRQVGKTTMLKRLADEGRHYVSLDDPDLRLLARTDPGLFLQRYQPPVLIDEVHYATELLPYIKMRVDENRQPGDYWLTGSQVFRLMKNVSESLAGRVGIVSLLGLSNAEIHDYPSVPYSTDPERLVKRIGEVSPHELPQIYERIFKGSMPELYARPKMDWETYYSSYVDTYLKRDVRDLSQVADEMQFFNFMTAVAANTARPVVYEELARAVGISSPTVKKWLSILVSSHIIALVQPYANNLLKRVVKMPLLHMLDTGLASYLLKWGNPEALERGAMSGDFFKSFVFSEIYKSFLNAGKEPPLYYYRDKDQKEIDLLIHQDGTLYPIEVKKAVSPGRVAIRHFDVLSPVETPEQFGELASLKTKIGSGNVLCMASDVIPIDQKNWFVPVWVV